MGYSFSVIRLEIWALGPPYPIVRTRSDFTGENHIGEIGMLFDRAYFVREGNSSWEKKIQVELCALTFRNLCLKKKNKF